MLLSGRKYGATFAAIESNSWVVSGLFIRNIDQLSRRFPTTDGRAHIIVSSVRDES